MSDIINDHKTQAEWKIHLRMVINFFYSKDSKETCVMYSKSNNKEVMGSETDKTIKDLFDSFLERFRRINEKKWIFFDSADSLYYKLHKISLNRGRSYIDSAKWLKSKKTTINPKNDDDKYLQYAATVALNH